MSHKPNIPDDMVERAAILFAQWLGYSWDGLPDADISDEYSDWALDGVGRKHLQGGKPAVRRIARTALAEAVMAAEKKAFYEGFWAWNGPANDAEFDRDIKLCDKAWETFLASRSEQEQSK